MAKKGKGRKGKGLEFAMMEDLEQALEKEKDKNRKLKKMMKGMKKKGKKDERMLDSYNKFMAPKASRKRTKKRKNRVQALVKNHKITPAAEKPVLAYATTLGLNIKKVSIGGKKRTLEDHFLRGLEKGDSDPIFREFAADPEVDWDDLLSEDEASGLSIGEEIAAEVGAGTQKKGD